MAEAKLFQWGSKRKAIPAKCRKTCRHNGRQRTRFVHFGYSNARAERYFLKLKSYFYFTFCCWIRLLRDFHLFDFRPSIRFIFRSLTRCFFEYLNIQYFSCKNCKNFRIRNASGWGVPSLQPSSDESSGLYYAWCFGDHYRHQYYVSDLNSYCYNSNYIEKEKTNLKLHYHYFYVPIYDSIAVYLISLAVIMQKLLLLLLINLLKILFANNAVPPTTNVYYLTAIGDRLETTSSLLACIN